MSGDKSGFKDMIRRRMGDILPEDIVAAADGYRANFAVRGTAGSIQDQWGKFDKLAPATGLYLPDEGVMLVDERGTAHHDQQWRFVADTLGVVSPVLPWASAVRGEDFVVEMGRSHGGLFEAITQRGDDVKRLTTGMSITPKMVLDVAYAARLADHPPENTTFEFAYAGEEVQDLPEEIKERVSPKRQEVPMADVYDLLRTTPEGLPDPLIDRGKL